MVSSYYRLVWEAAGGQAWVIERYVEEPSLVALDLEAEIMSTVTVDTAEVFGEI